MTALRRIPYLHAPVHDVVSESVGTAPECAFGHAEAMRSVVDAYPHAMTRAAAEDRLRIAGLTEYEIESLLRAAERHAA